MKKCPIKKHLPIPARLTLMLIFLWVFFVLYPNPSLLGKSIYRLVFPPVSPAAVLHLADQLQDHTPREIEYFVYKTLPYHFDWQVYYMPWYYPKLGEALERGKGDCKARFLLFASILEALEIPHVQHISLTHVWVEYEGKTETTIENSAAALVTTGTDGQQKLQLPQISLADFVGPLRQGFWDVMPPLRRILLLGGPPLILMFSWAWNTKAVTGHDWAPLNYHDKADKKLLHNLRLKPDTKGIMVLRKY